MNTEQINNIIVTHREEAQLKDSLTFSTPSKGGEIKVYVDFSNTEETQNRIKKAFEARRFAQNLEGGF